jgi:hypothetical protein
LPDAVETLEHLLSGARSARPADRVAYRDRLVALGEQAIEPMSVWLSDPVLGAFAVRVLARIGQAPAARSSAIAALAGRQAAAGSPAIQRDIQATLSLLGGRPLAPRRAPSRSRAVGTPGKPGRRYWATHTWERSNEGDRQRAYIWAEIQRGHLRQGWGWDPEQDLNVIARAVHEGWPLTDEQRMAWPAQAMLTSSDDGMRYDDLVVVVGVPDWGKHVIVQVCGPYEFDPGAQIRDYGHLVPIRLAAGPIGRYDSNIAPALFDALKNRQRLWRIDGVGGEVEQLLRARATDAHA